MTGLIANICGKCNFLALCLFRIIKPARELCIQDGYQHFNIFISDRNFCGHNGINRLYSCC